MTSTTDSPEVSIADTLRDEDDLAREDAVPFHSASISEEDIAAVVTVMRSGWLTTGARCREFETAFARMLGDEVEALTTSSCTAALHLALEAVGVTAGDLVITTPYTFAATAEVIRYVGAEPVFADVDSSTGNLTPATVAEAFEDLSAERRSRVRCLLPVHFGGLPCDMKGLSALAQQHRWWLVDDAAHALPAAHHGVPIGRWADATAFSFYATKTLCTGEGGMLVTRRPEIAARARTMRLHGIDSDVFDRYSRADSWRYRVVASGFKYNLTDMAAAMGLSQLRRLHALRARRARVASRYDEAFAEVDGLGLPAGPPPGDEHAWHLYALRVLGGQRVRDQLVRELAAEGIGSSVHFIPLHLHPCYAELTPRSGLPSATRMFGEEISLPLFPDMTSRQVSRVEDALPDALARATARW